MRVALALAMLLTFVSPAAAPAGGEVMARESIREALGKHTDELMSVSGVVGVAEGLCKGIPCIKVYVTEKTPQVEKEISLILGSVPADIEETGEFRALPEKEPETH